MRPRADNNSVLPRASLLSTWILSLHDSLECTQFGHKVDNFQILWAPEQKQRWNQDGGPWIALLEQLHLIPKHCHWKSWHLTENTLSLKCKLYIPLMCDVTCISFYLFVADPDSVSWPISVFQTNLPAPLVPRSVWPGHLHPPRRPSPLNNFTNMDNCTNLINMDAIDCYIAQENTSHLHVHAVISPDSPRLQLCSCQMILW